jgi:hypothetical protein
MRVAAAGCMLFSVLGCCVEAQQAAQPAMIKGWIEVKAERHPLTHVFAVMEADKLEEGNKQNVALLLSDKAVPDPMRVSGDTWAFWAAEQARAGALKGIIILIDPETKVWTRGQWLSSQGMMFYTHTSTEPEGRILRFEPAEPAAGEIAGKVWMKETMGGLGEGPWRVEAEFRTPVIPMPKVTATITGAEALKSPQYKAVVAFLTACKKKDLEAIRMSMDADSQVMLAEAVKQQGQKTALEMFAGMAEESLKLKTVQVTVRGSVADVKLSENKAGERNEHELKVGLANGVWKLTR